MNAENEAYIVRGRETLHGGRGFCCFEDCYCDVQGYDALYSGRWLRSFWMKLLPPFTQWQNIH